MSFTVTIPKERYRARVGVNKGREYRYVAIPYSKLQVGDIVLRRKCGSYLFDQQDMDFNIFRAKEPRVVTHLTRGSYSGTVVKARRSWWPWSTVMGHPMHHNVVVLVDEETEYVER